jgi:hypothetical protein
MKLIRMLAIALMASCFVLASTLSFSGSASRFHPFYASFSLASQADLSVEAIYPPTGGNRWQTLYVRDSTGSIVALSDTQFTDGTPGDLKCFVPQAPAGDYTAEFIVSNGSSPVTVKVDF